MGQKISQSKNTVDINVYLNKFYSSYTPLKVLNNGMLNKTVLLLNEGENKCPLVAKIFFKQDYEEEYKKQLDRIIETQNKIVNECLHNVLPLIYKVENNRSGIIFRQYLEFNLKERIYLMPYLNNIQKLWISFQILYAVNDLTDLNIVHGDLKPENILLTSNLSVYISDIATYKPGYISMNDIGNYTFFFGTNKNDTLTGCYFAPERLLDKGETIDEKKTFSMDVFSVGLIIAELFLEKNIFDFSSLLNYKKNNIDYDKIEDLLGKIPKQICDIIKDMIKINPEERITIKEALQRFSNEVCPITMTGFLLHFNAIVNSTIFWKPDLIIGFIYRYWSALWKMMFGPEDEPSMLYQHLNLSIINKIILENNFSGKFTKKDDNYLFLNNYKLFFDIDSGNIKEKEMNDLKNLYDKNHNFECVYIIINFLIQNLQNTKYDSSNLVALEMLKYLSYKLDDITKLKLIIPYFVENLKRENYTTKVVTLNFLLEIFYSIDYKKLILPVTEYNYFDSYVFPVLLNVFKLQKHELILEFFNNIDKIIDLQEKFLNLTMKAKLLKLNQMHNDNDNDKKDSEENLDEMKLRITKDKRNEIFLDYDASMEEFKSSLLKVVNDLMGEINDIDILIIVIRKLPKLFLFYGRSKSNDFLKFFVNNFNKPDWIVQKEILCHIPEMMTLLGENEYILSCMEMFIDNNSNELKTLELIKALHELFKMEYLPENTALDFFKKLMPFLLHPNLNIKNAMINFFESLIKFIPLNKVFNYLYESLSEYISIPLMNLNRDILSQFLIERINRISYQLELRRKDDLNINNNKSKNDTFENKLNTKYKKQLNLYKNIITRQKEGDLANNNGDINYTYENSSEKDQYTYLKKYKEYGLKEPIEKYFKKGVLNLSDESDIKEFIQKMIFGVFYLSDSIENFSFPFPHIKDIPTCYFATENNILTSEMFNIFYIFKTLSLSIKSTNVNDFLHPEKTKRSITTTAGVHILSNHMFNKTFHDWRPQGQIITTLYDHDKNHVEKILPYQSNIFCSFDNEGCANMYRIINNNKDNDELIVKKIWYSGNEMKFPIKYKNTITMIDNLNFLTASQNKICIYNPNYAKGSPRVIEVLYELEDGARANITCLKPFGVNSLESQKIIIGTEKEGINIYDQRMKSIALKNQTPIDYGMISCISETYSRNNFYIGTIGGHLLDYDLRLNSIIKDYTYSDNIPILGIMPYKLYKNCNYDLSSIIKSQNYFLIWTAAFDHEIGLWNNYTMNCDLLLKVNTLEFKGEFKPLTVEIPYLKIKNGIYYKEISEKRRKVKNELNSIIKFSHLYNNNFTNSLILSNLDPKVKESTFNIFNNMINLYDNPSTVQCVVSPLCESNPSFDKTNIEYSNSPYIISAGNDMIIRYWDITREGLNNEKKLSYIINAPNNLTYCNFTKSSFDKTNILQSNEAFNEPGQRTDMPGFSPFLNYNGVSLHYIPQSEFDNGLPNLRFCSRIADASHKSVITDILPMCIDEKNNQSNVLISSSWDGKIKVWK